MTILHVAELAGATFAQALDAAPRAFALLITPSRFEVTTVSAVHPSETEDVYEARLFGERAELRWLATSGGHAVFLTEDRDELPSFFTPLAPVVATGVCDGQYLLWGRGAGEAREGWTTLATERIGSIRVPAEVEQGGYAAVKTREYIVQDPEHGNSHIAEERLLAFARSAVLKLERP